MGGNPPQGSGPSSIDVTDRATRLLGQISGSTDVTDRATRLLGQISGISGTVTITTENRNSFTAQVVNAPTTGAFLPNISVPNGFALVIRAFIDNTGQVFVADSILNATTSGVPGNRNTLNAGDTIKLFISNANLVAVAGSTTNQNIDILVEQ